MNREQEDEKKIIEDAKKEAAEIIRQAEECAREIHGASLQYVDDMLLEISLAAKRAKENIRIIMEQVLEDLDQKIDIIESNKFEIYEDLKEFTENGTRPIRKANYEIKIDENYIAKQGYQIKITDGKEEHIETIKPAKQPFEIKIANEWRGRIEQMLEEQNQLSAVMEEKAAEPEPEEIEDSFQAADFDLDLEYFNWLEDKE